MLQIGVLADSQRPKIGARHGFGLWKRESPPSNERRSGIRH